MDPVWFGQCAVSAFFAIAFLQSAADKWLDSKGNLEFLTGHFSKSPLAGTVTPMFWAITVIESAAGILCAIGAVQVLFGLVGELALWGITVASVALLGLFFGQRMAQDYAGAAVIASYFAVALLGLVFFRS